MKALQVLQAVRVFEAFERAGLSFLVERTPRGWHVELEQDGAHDGVAADGETVVDAMAQIAQVLTLDEGFEFQSEPLPDDVIPYAVADVVPEFAPVVPQDSDEWRAWLETLREEVMGRSETCTEWAVSAE